MPDHSSEWQEDPVDQVRQAELLDWLNKKLRLDAAVAAETPTKMLGPEAHEDALVAAKDLWAICAQELGKNYGVSLDVRKEGRDIYKATIYGKKFLETRSGFPADTDMVLITRDDERDMVGNETVNRIIERKYGLSPTQGVIMQEWHHSWGPMTDSHKGIWPPKGPKLVKEEQGRLEIAELSKLVASSFLGPQIIPEPAYA